ncbi:MAG: MmgE/PrpD family protein [Actinomycetes bacterium]
MSVAGTLTDWALSLETLPDDVRTVAISHLYDGFGDALGALYSRTKVPATAVAEIYASKGGESPLLGRGSRVSAPFAALSFGALIHHLDFDDTHAGGLVHATSVSLPAAIAIGASVDASWDDIVTAATIGLETVTRIAMGSSHGFHARGIHATHACGTVAAALVAAKLLGLSREETINSIGIAGSASGGLLEFLNTGSSTKQLHPGTASRYGVIAALLAGAGGTGPESAIEGRYGIYATLSAREVELDLVTSDLGSRWEATQITIKPYPACQLSHVSLDAVASIMVGYGAMAAGDIEKIEVWVHPDSSAIVCEPIEEKLTPRTPYDAKFSLPWSIAALIIDGAITVETYSIESIHRPEVAALAQKVAINLTPAEGAAADASGKTRISLRSGASLNGGVNASAGGPRNRLTRQALINKFAGNAQCTPKKAAEFYDVLESPEATLVQVVKAFEVLAKGA